MKVCFTASSGGHLEQLMMLYPMMKKHESIIVTEDTEYKFDTKGIKTYKLNQINRREVLFFCKFTIIFLKSLEIFLKEKPDILVSTGALATIPICIIAKMFKKKIIFIESFSKINSRTITGKFMYKIADLFIVQWEDMKKLYPDAIYGGGIY
ncbi:PssD/Cps14F family polysaccharide biosynthesis glycosyltransferase [Metabacillus sp. SLBN-84]